MDLNGFFKPTSVAVVGASRNPAKVGHVILKNLIDGGFKGLIFPINPETDNLLGYRVYPSLIKVTDSIDLGIIAVPAESVLETIDECKKKKIKNVLIVTAGFGEIGNVDLEKKLKEKLDSYGMRCVGVNCLGIFDAYHNFDTLFLPRYRLTRPKPGGISFVCQSGAIGSAILDIASTNGYKFSKFVSYGNATQIDESDLLEYLGNDETTKVICMYIEGIKNGEKFFQTLSKVTLKKPVIILKGGLTDAGKRATISHTGSLAGDSAVFFGVLEQTNSIRANSLEEMFHVAALVEKGVHFGSNRLQIITNGGGYGILSIDSIASSKHAKLAILSTNSLAEIKKFAPKHMNIGNPLDLLGDATTERYRKAIDVCISDSGVDGLVVIALYQTPLLTTEIVEIISEAHNNSKKPIIVVSTGGEFTDLLSRSLRERGLPVFSYPDEAIIALDKLIAYQLRAPKPVKIIDKKEIFVIKKIKTDVVKKKIKNKKFKKNK